MECGFFIIFLYRVGQWYSFSFVFKIVLQLIKNLLLSIHVVPFLVVAFLNWP